MTWAYRPILTKIQEQDLTKYSIGIDMSSVFDTIWRDKLIEITEELLSNKP